MRVSAAALALFAVVAVFVDAIAQGYLRVKFQIDRSGPNEIRLIGRIFNDTDLDARDIRLRVQALDAAGKVVVEPRAQVQNVVPAHGEGYWDASMPPDPRILGFKVVVVGQKFSYQVR
jgi:hypothetical protein